MVNLIGCISAFVLSLLLSNLEFLDDREIKIITILGWVIALLFSKGEFYD